jgi:hypothetical protein
MSRQKVELNGSKRVDERARAARRRVGRCLCWTIVTLAVVAPARAAAQGAAAAPAASGQAAAAPSPAEIRYKGVTLVPGGFIEAAVIYRSANENADVGSTFINVPYEGSANSNLSEFRGSARQSRLSLLVSGKSGRTKMSGYWEFDFLGAAPTANEVESNSFNVRQRQLWAHAEIDGGFSFVAGQTWSLVTLNRVGIAPRAEWVPLTIDAQYVVGYDWTRQWGARVTQKLAGGKFWLAGSAENPETTVSAVNAPSGVFGLNTSPNATSPSSQIVVNSTPGANGVSTDPAPDLVGKVAFEPGLGHYEIKGLLRFFRDRIDGANNTEVGGGIGFGAIVPLAKKIDLLAEGMLGSGIGRYGSGQMPDVTLDPKGAITPIEAWHLLAGVEAHPTATLDVYGYFGREHSGQSAFVNAAGKGVGYGSPQNDNSACSVEVPAAGTACQAQARDIWQIQPGFWYRFHKGPEGTLQAGLSYSYTQKDTWPGAGGLAPRGRDHIVMASFRYYIP